MELLQIFSDGAVSGNGDKLACGGWAAAVIKEGKIIGEVFGHEKGTTNQRMELTAAIKGLQYGIDNFASFGEKEIELNTDSAYIANCFSAKWYINWRKNGWVNAKKQPVANKDLWEILIPIVEKHNIKIVKVKGHTGEKDFNDYVDRLAVSEREKARKDEER